MPKILLLIITHLGFAAVGFALGVFALPILMAPDAPSSSEIAELQEQTIFSGQFRRDLEDSDSLHWGEGKLYVSQRQISLEGSLAPGA